jgi:hypothetical protein
MSRVGTVILMVACAVTFVAAGPPPAAERQAPAPPAPKPFARPTDNDYWALAAADLRTLPRDEQLFTRYVPVLDGTKETLQAVTLALGYLSRAATPTRPTPIGDFARKLLLLRVNVRDYAPRQPDTDEWTATWELLQFEPRYNLLLTKATLRFALGLGVVTAEQVKKARPKVLRARPPAKESWTTRTVTVDHPGGAYTYPDDTGRVIPSVPAGKYTVELKFRDKAAPAVEEVDVDDIDVLRVVSEHLDKRLVAEVIERTQSQAPLVTDRYLVFRGLSAVNEDAEKGDNDVIYKTLYGGLYYEFAGIKESKDRGVTDEDLFLEGVGAGNVKGKLKAKDFYAKLRSDQRVLKKRSAVTSSPRAADVFPTAATQPNFGTSIGSITHDVKRKRIDIDRRAFMNLIDFQDDAREGIFTNAFGLHKFVLFNGAGKLQRFAPQDVVHDSTVPQPYHDDLQPAISCIRCHGLEGGWRELKNDLPLLLRGGVEPFYDLALFGADRRDVLDRLAGLYAGDLERKALPRARDDYAAAILSVTGPWAASKAQTDLVALSAAKLGRIYADYFYTEADATTALRDLGRVTGAEVGPPAVPPEKLLRQLLAPVPLPGPLAGPVPGDPRIGFLLGGGSIPRPDYDLVWSFIATRAARAPK